jgi:hypothetical protein
MLPKARVFFLSPSLFGYIIKSNLNANKKKKKIEKKGYIKEMFPLNEDFFNCG